MTYVGDDPAARTLSSDINRDSNDALLLEAVSQGSVPAFHTLVEGTSMAVRAVLEELLCDRERQDEVLAATYLEVWWLAGCHTQPDVDATKLIVGIACRRAAETHADPVPDGEEPRTGYAQVEFADLLRRTARRAPPVTVRAAPDQVAVTPDR